VLLSRPSISQESDQAAMVVAFGAKWALILVLGIPLCSGIIAGPDFSENTQIRTSITRRESESHRTSRRKRASDPDGVSVDPHAALFKLSSLHEKRHVQHRERSILDKLDIQDCGLNSTKLCAIQYVLGKVNGTNCSDPSETLLIDPEACHRAGDSAGVDHNDTFFYIDSTWYDRRPKGCFAYPCDRGTAGVCYFFNGIADWPNVNSGQFAGRPVCMRQKFLNGARNQNGGCPTGYHSIADNATCEEFADCRSHCKGAYFDVTAFNYSQHHEFPVGCFLRDCDGCDGCAYFNPPDDIKPLRPKGMPVCHTGTVEGLTKENFWTYEGR